MTILGMILLGGVTRLTESGLSMVDWRPIMGIPPLTEAQWLDTFAAYQQYPEYQKINQGMDLSGFKQIFWFEYLHRVLGRLIGLMYFVPLVVFAFRRMITPQLLPTLIVLLILGAAQGLLGWYMVKSGLVDRPGVPVQINCAFGCRCGDLRSDDVARTACQRRLVARSGIHQRLGLGAGAGRVYVDFIWWFYGGHRRRICLPHMANDG